MGDVRCKTCGMRTATDPPSHVMSGNASTHVIECSDGSLDRQEALSYDSVKPYTDPPGTIDAGSHNQPFSFNEGGSTFTGTLNDYPAGQYTFTGNLTGTHTFQTGGYGILTGTITGPNGSTSFVPFTCVPQGLTPATAPKTLTLIPGGGP